MTTPNVPEFLLLDGRRVDLAARRIDPWPLNLPDARAAPAGRLTRTEVAILRLLASHAPSTVSRDEMLRVLWNLSARSSRTLDTHITRLRRKLEEDPAAPRFLLTVYRVGYRLEWPRELPQADHLPRPGASNGYFGHSNSASASP